MVLYLTSCARVDRHNRSVVNQAREPDEGVDVDLAPLVHVLQVGHADHAVLDEGGEAFNVDAAHADDGCARQAPRERPRAFKALTLIIALSLTGKGLSTSDILAGGQWISKCWNIC